MRFGQRFNSGLAISSMAVIALTGCKTNKAPEPPKLSSVELKELSIVPKIAGGDKLSNTHAAMLFEADRKLHTEIIDGEPASTHPEVASLDQQRERQLQNAIHERPTGKITNGRPVSTSRMSADFTYQVALVYTSFPDVPDGQFCGGSLINASWILTAAHCVRTLQPQDVQIYVGSFDLASGGHLVTLATNGIIKHEQYNSSDTYPLNDIALLKLASPISDIAPIELANSNNKTGFYNTNNALISGWGDTAQGSGNGSVNLLYATVAIVPQATCNADYNGRITPGMLCAAAPQTDSCQGDSGGPLTVFGTDKKLYQLGIVSWGTGCAQPKFPGVYVSLLDYADWITTHMQ